MKRFQHGIHLQFVKRYGLTAKLPVHIRFSSNCLIRRISCVCYDRKVLVFFVCFFPFRVFKTVQITMYAGVDAASSNEYWGFRALTLFFKLVFYLMWIAPALDSMLRHRLCSFQLNLVRFRYSFLCNLKEVKWLRDLIAWTSSSRSL